jgi:Short C-terminal domain
VPLLRRRPLLRAAAVGGTAYLAGKKAQQGAQGGLAASAAPTPANGGSTTGSGGLSRDAMDQLKSLAQLHDQGILTDQEFDEQKEKVLRS